MRRRFPRQSPNPKRKRKKRPRIQNTLEIDVETARADAPRRVQNGMQIHLRERRRKRLAIRTVFAETLDRPTRKIRVRTWTRPRNIRRQYYQRDSHHHARHRHRYRHRPSVRAVLKRDIVYIVYPGALSPSAVYVRRPTLLASSLPVVSVRLHAAGEIYTLVRFLMCTSLVLFSSFVKVYYTLRAHIFVLVCYPSSFLHTFRCLYIKTIKSIVRFLMCRRVSFYSPRSYR